MVGGGEEDEPERALDVDEHLVPEPHEQRQHDRQRHRAEREHAGEHRPARAGPEEVERRARRRSVAAAGEDEDDVAEQQHEGGLAEDAVCPVHAVEPAEERLDRPQPSAEHEVERERRRAGEARA